MGKIRIIKLEGLPITEYEVTSIGFLMSSGDEVRIPFNKGTKLKDILGEKSPLLQTDE